MGLLQDQRGYALVSRRAAGVHLEGLWEFPGGKCAPGETARAALDRELWEELGIGVLAATEILAISHGYRDLQVDLTVFRVDAWRGVVVGREGQPLRWVGRDELRGLRFPEASRAIVNAALLPPLYLISPDPFLPEAVDREALRVEERLVHGDIRLLQVRAPGLERGPFLTYARRLLDAAERHRVDVLVNAPRAWLERLPPAGWHLTEQRLRALSARPACAGWLAASVHDREGLERAMALPVDFVVAGPVRPTQTHPGAPAMGMAAFAALRAGASCPVYALGGLCPDDLPALRQAGAQGIAAIRGLLGSR